MFWVFYELQGKDIQQKVYLVKFEEHTVDLLTGNE